jgi:hypothetical protein
MRTNRAGDQESPEIRKILMHLDVARDLLERSAVGYAVATTRPDERIAQDLLGMITLITETIDDIGRRERAPRLRLVPGGRSGA